MFIDSVPSILIGVNSLGWIVRWNLAAAETFGLPGGAVKGKPLTDCGIAWLDPDIEQQVRSWLTAEDAKRIDNLGFQKDGKKRFLGLTLKRVDFTTTEGLYLLIMGADITDRTHLEVQLRQAQKLEAIGQLAAGIAHEINTPAQYVMDNTTFLKDSWPTVEKLIVEAQKVIREYPATCELQEMIFHMRSTLETADVGYLCREVPHALDQSLEGIRRISAIVRAMKEFSHPDSSEKQLVDINRALTTAITVSRNEWKYVADVETNFDPQLPPVSCFAGEFNQVIINLLVNSAHTIKDAAVNGKKGLITITSRQVEGFVEISVKDTGAGIPKSIQSRIFEPFFTTKEVGKGTGQGLALAHRVIEQRHGGRIWFESDIDVGTTFFMLLPLDAH
jgi:PAS domain S-box-containing protein